MGVFDKVKGLVGGNKDQIKKGVDTAAGMAASKVPSEHADKVGQAADAVKGAVDKLPE